MFLLDGMRTLTNDLQDEGISHQEERRSDVPRITRNDLSKDRESCSTLGAKFVKCHLQRPHQSQRWAVGWAMA